MTFQIWKNAIIDGDLQTVKKLHLVNTPGINSSIVDYAASFGHLDIVQFLLENRSEGCTSWAMDWSAGNNRFDVLKYLHTKGKFCTYRAMDFSAMNGYINIVKWLHTHRIEGCTKNALNDAFYSGDLDIIIFLYNNRTDGFDHEFALDNAIYNKHWHVVKWYRDTIETVYWKKLKLDFLLTFRITV
jgi:hypothetical protein